MKFTDSDGLCGFQKMQELLILCVLAPSRLCVLILSLTQGRKGAETQRMLLIVVCTSFALVHIQRTIIKFSDCIEKFVVAHGKL